MILCCTGAAWAFGFGGHSISQLLFSPYFEQKIYQTRIYISHSLSVETHNSRRHFFFLFSYSIHPLMQMRERRFVREFFSGAQGLELRSCNSTHFFGGGFRNGEGRKNSFQERYSCSLDRLVTNDYYLKTAETGSAGQGDVADVGR
jgi:hypothetical protein